MDRRDLHRKAAHAQGYAWAYEETGNGNRQLFPDVDGYRRILRLKGEVYTVPEYQKCFNDGVTEFIKDMNEAGGA